MIVAAPISAANQGVSAQVPNSLLVQEKYRDGGATLRAGVSKPSGVSTSNFPLYLDSVECVHLEFHPEEKSSKNSPRTGAAAAASRMVPSNMVLAVFRTIFAPIMLPTLLRAQNLIITWAGLGRQLGPCRPRGDVLAAL